MNGENEPGASSGKNWHKGTEAAKEYQSWVHERMSDLWSIFSTSTPQEQQKIGEEAKKAGGLLQGLKDTFRI